MKIKKKHNCMSIYTRIKVDQCVWSGKTIINYKIDLLSIVKQIYKYFVVKTTIVICGYFEKCMKNSALLK